MPPNRPPRSADGPPWWLIALIIGALIAALAAWRAGLFGGDNEMIPSHAGAPAAGESASGSAESSEPQTLSPAQAQASADAAAATAAAEKAEADAQTPSGPRYPVRSLDEAERRAAPLPEPGRSDAPIAQALLSLAPRSTLAQFLNLQDFVRRLVITVDNLPRRIVPSQHSAVRPIRGPLAVVKLDDRVELSAGNSLRYDAFVSFAEILDPKVLANLYVRFYPLLQYEYREMGFPQGHFNDRVVAAIDDMLSAPRVSEPIQLVQPKVLYRFADPALESQSAGRKIMIRVGPDNARRLRTVLSRLRDELTSLGR